MNERIRELLVEAREQTQEGKWHAPVAVWAEKFAELIVQECVGVVENLSPGYNDYRNQIEDAFRGDCVGKIREHFGVEE